MRMKIELDHGHIYAGDLPLIALAMMSEWVKKLEANLTNEFAEGLIFGAIITAMVAVTVIINA